MSYVIAYIIIGVLETIFCIWFYRRDGQTKEKNELYFAAIGFLLWPVLLLKFVADLISKKK